MERDLFQNCTAIISVNFNSHAHVERDLDVLCDTARVSDFNSHAHVERDQVKPTQRTLIRISTHTLTWSVTNKAVMHYLKENISTHTLTWSVTSNLNLE